MSIFRPKNVPAPETENVINDSRVNLVHWGVLVMFTLIVTTILTSNINSSFNSYDGENEVAAVSKAVEVKTEPVATGKSVESNRIVVKFKEGKQAKGLSIAAEKANLEKAQGLKKLLDIENINAFVYEVSEDDTAAEVVKRIKNNHKEAIEYVEVDMLVPPALVPNDVNYSAQWHHPNVHAPEAWDIAQGEGVIVAVLDTGVNPHEDLKFSSEAGWNFYDNNNNTADVNGHGTAVAGTLAAVGNNSVGGSGMAPKSEVLPIRISDPSAYAYFSAMAQGITYAADHGAKVVNLSYGNACDSSTVLSAARYLRSKGGIVTISAENEGIDNGMIAANETVCVSATGSNDLRTTWSSYGASVDVTAPGASIYTTTANGSYANWNGTSFAAPLTAGVYALMFSANPELTPDQADSILFSTADDLGDNGWDVYYGYGKINAAKAVALAASTTGTNVIDKNSPTIPENLRTTSVSANQVALSWNNSTDNVAVAKYGVYRDWAKLAEVTGTSYADNSVLPQSNYTYTVTAIDTSANESGNSQPPLSVITPSLPFSIISDIVTTKTSNSATIDVKLSTAGTVIIQYGTEIGNLSMTAAGTKSATAHTINLSNLTAKKIYYYKVIATNADNNKAESIVSSFKTPAPTTTGGKRR